MVGLDAARRLGAGMVTTQTEYALPANEDGSQPLTPQEARTLRRANEAAVAAVNAPRDLLDRLWLRLYGPVRVEHNVGGWVMYLPHETAAEAQRGRRMNRRTAAEVAFWWAMTVPVSVTLVAEIVARVCAG